MVCATFFFCECWGDASAFTLYISPTLLFIDFPSRIPASSFLLASFFFLFIVKERKLLGAVRIKSRQRAATMGNMCEMGNTGRHKLVYLQRS